MIFIWLMSFQAMLAVLGILSFNNKFSFTVHPHLSLWYLLLKLRGVEISSF
jgi:hypothetical protein